ncbi:hypothetical protein F8M41_023117 [Gigaspora margarita]|uniref:Uncharacterized protein n=1 Tax=Gigaspora margarita TaxID=4874 RepID=A0A8H4ADW7_GIGMA|nr:hypothetical protein F8M41_023117 [Gigaspora margarita]
MFAKSFDKYYFHTECIEDLNSLNIDLNDLKLFVNGLFHNLQEDINSNMFPNILKFDNFILKIHIEKLNPQCNRRTNDNLQLFKKECKKNKFNCLLVLMDGDDETLNYLQMLVQNINRNHKLKLTYPISHIHSNRIIHQNLVIIIFRNHVFFIPQNCIEVADLGYTPLDHSQEISHVNSQCLNFKNYNVIKKLDICGIFLYEISLSKQLEHITKTKGFHFLISNAIKELSNESSGN